MGPSQTLSSHFLHFDHVSGEGGVKETSCGGYSFNSAWSWCATNRYKARSRLRASPSEMGETPQLSVHWSLPAVLKTLATVLVAERAAATTLACVTVPETFGVTEFVTDTFPELMTIWSGMVSGSSMNLLMLYRTCLVCRLSTVEAISIVL